MPVKALPDGTFEEAVYEADHVVMTCAEEAAQRWRLTEALEKIEELRMQYCEISQNCNNQIRMAWDEKEMAIAFERERAAKEYSALRERYDDAVQKIFRLAAEIDKLTMKI